MTDPDRNAPCPCGSGEKFKNCCGVSAPGEAPPQPPATAELTLLQAVELAIQHHLAGDLTQAESIYRQVLQADPNNFDALHLLGVIENQKGNYFDSVKLILQALEIKPDHADAYNNLGAALKNLGNLGEAMECYRQALALKPEFPDAHYNMGEIFLEQHDYDSAALSYQYALRLKPNYPQAENNLGIALVKLGQYEEGIAAYRRALAMRPDYLDARYNLGIDLEKMGHLDEALIELQTTLDFDPRYEKAYHAMISLLEFKTDTVEAISYFRRALAAKPDSPQLHSALAYSTDVDPTLSAQEQQDERRHWYETQVKPRGIPHLPLINTPESGRKLRIGYIPGRFYHNPSLFTFLPMLLDYDRSRFEVYCYSNFDHTDDVTERIKASITVWRDIVRLTDEEAAKLIRDDGIDILVDLFAHGGANRLFIYAYKPAPILITAWGHANGTGMTEMDYLISDPVTIPLEERAFYAEKIIDLPCLLAYWCPENAPPVAELPSRKTGITTFGCFNRTVKVSDKALELWAELLARQPDSALILKDEGWTFPAKQAHIHKIFRAKGVEPERIVFLGRSNWLDHLKAYELVDIALDPFPLGGGVTTLDALWMGVPVVCMKGDTLGKRIASAIVSAIGLGDWTAVDSEQYLSVAMRKSNNISSLSRLRERMRERIFASPIGNPDYYVRLVEQHYRRAWEEWCHSQDGSDENAQTPLESGSPALTRQAIPDDADWSKQASSYADLLSPAGHADPGWGAATLDLAQALWKTTQENADHPPTLRLLAVTALKYGKFNMALEVLIHLLGKNVSLPEIEVKDSPLFEALAILERIIRPWLFPGGEGKPVPDDAFVKLSATLLSDPASERAWMWQIHQTQTREGRIAALAIFLSSQFLVATNGVHGTGQTTDRPMDRETNADLTAHAESAHSNGANDLTVVIPSKGRLVELESLLHYFVNMRLKFKVLVLESGDFYGAIRDIGGLDLELVQYPDGCLPFEKLQDAFSRLVHTPLVCMATDDDFLTKAGIEESARFLLANPDYSACQGYHGRFEMQGADMALLDIVWYTPSIENPDPLKRLSALVRRYQPICWAVFRSDVMREAVSTFHLAGNYLMAELMWSTTAVLKGKVKRLPMIYCLRRKDDIHLMGHPLYAFLESPQKFFESYQDYRNVVLDRFLPQGEHDRDELARQFDLIHACYFAREINREKLEFFTDKTLNRPGTSIHDKDIRNIIQPPASRSSKAPHQRIAGRTRNYAAYPLFMYPQPASEIPLPEDFLAELVRELDSYPLS